MEAWYCVGMTLLLPPPLPLLLLMIKPIFAPHTEQKLLPPPLPLLLLMPLPPTLLLLPLLLLMPSQHHHCATYLKTLGMAACKLLLMPSQHHHCTTTTAPSPSL